MSDDGIVLDSDESAEEKPAKKKDLVGTLMVVMVIVAFGCLAGALTLQFLEYRYMRGVDKPGDPYASEVLLPPQS
jgi:hypothetical protein